MDEEIDMFKPLWRNFAEVLKLWTYVHTVLNKMKNKFLAYIINVDHEIFYYMMENLPKLAWSLNEVSLSSIANSDDKKLNLLRKKKSIIMWYRWEMNIIRQFPPEQIAKIDMALPLRK